MEHCSLVIVILQCSGTPYNVIQILACTMGATASSYSQRKANNNAPMDSGQKRESCKHNLAFERKLALAQEDRSRIVEFVKEEGVEAWNELD